MRRAIVVNVALLLASCVAMLLMFEIALRLLYPKYDHLANQAIVYGQWRRRPPNHRGTSRDPDTHVPHAFYHNNWGLRQNRNFSAKDLETSVNVGFFGDSFTENTRVPAPFSFTEPLDYLLNVNAGPREVNVLNFGMNEYGLSQSLHRYETWKFRQILDHVFYVHYENDVRDDADRGMFRLDDAGQLARMDRPRSVVRAFLSKMHLSYLALDATGRVTALLSDRAKHQMFQRKDEERPLALFRQQLRRFKAVVEQDGASFTLVYLPMEDYAASGVEDIVRAEGIETINLRDCFGERDPTHLQTPWFQSPYRFRRDTHFNKAGNRLAASCLHQFLAGRLGLPELPEEEVGQTIDRYYAAFETLAEPRAKQDNGVAGAELAALRRKYNALEGIWPELGAPWAPSRDKLVIRADFDVYLHDGWLAYVQEDCQVDNSYLDFYLHVVPMDAQDLPAHRLEYGFDNLDFSYFFREPPCTAWRPLPDYRIAKIMTGGLSESGMNPNHKRTWEAEYVIAN